MQRGYIKLWRRFLESPLWANQKLSRFWFYCLLKATHKPFDAMVGFRRVHLEPGQFVFGRRTAARETGLSVKSVRTCLAALCGKNGNQTASISAHQTAHRMTIITICNWARYQNQPDQNGPPNGPRRAHEGPHTRIQEHKKEKQTSSSADADRAGEHPSKPSEADLELPAKFNTDTFKTAWAEWIKVRKAKGKVKDWQLMFQKQLEWLASLYDAPAAIEVLNQSIRNGWTGLIALKTTPVQPRKQSIRL